MKHGPPYEGNRICGICEDEIAAEEFCARCGYCEFCCDCDGALFDADELGLDPEEDDLRMYGPGPGLSHAILRELEELHRVLPIPGDPNA